MTKIKYLLFSLALCYTFYACEKQEPLTSNDYMLHCLLIEGEAPKIKIGRTLKTITDYPFDLLYYDQLGYQPDDYNSELEITIKNNELIYDLFELEYIQDIKDTPSDIPLSFNQISYLTNKEIEIKPGADFEIQADIFGQNEDFNWVVKETLRAKTIIPERVSLDVSQLANSASPMEDYFTNAMVYEISFNDVAEKNNYYYLIVYKINPGTVDINNVNLDSLWLDRSIGSYQDYDPDRPNMRVLRNHGGEAIFVGFELENTLPFDGLLLDDEQFNGTKKVITLELDTFYDGSGYLFIDLLHISEEYYNYYYALVKQNENREENIYAEPVQLYTNIENGLGIFAGASLSRQILKIESKP